MDPMSTNANWWQLMVLASVDGVKLWFDLMKQQQIGYNLWHIIVSVSTVYKIFNNQGSQA